MAEIERKFIVEELPPDVRDTPAERIRQGYLSVAPAEVRVRSIGGSTHELTVKSAGDLVRTEVTVALTPEQFEELWQLTEGRIEKARTRTPVQRWTAEVDVYAGGLAGLVVVEVEFASEADGLAFTPPAWFGTEVTTDARYRNAPLALAGAPPR